MATNNWFVYIIRCADQSYYTGITTDVERRLQQHNGEQKGGARYTTSRRPVKLVYQEDCADRSSASQREMQIKSLHREQKEKLVNEFQAID